MEKATIFDYNRMCKFYGESCSGCPLEFETCSIGGGNYTIINEAVLGWREEHPLETNLDRFRKIFPNCMLTNHGGLDMCPQKLNKKISCIPDLTCEECKEHFWDDEYTCF